MWRYTDTEQASDKGITVGGEFGHEVCCRIKEVGARVEGLSPGDRVYPYPRLVTGDPAKAGTIGGFSELIGAPVIREGIEVYKLSDRTEIFRMQQGPGM